jgi:hypothetical protein
MRQETLLRAIYALPMSEDQVGLYHACTGRQAPPAAPFAEATVIAGARAGKDSRIAAPIVVYEAIFGEHEHHLARGERATIPLVAQDQRATKIAFGYIRDYLTRSPVLKAEVNEVLANEIQLRNGLSIFCFPCTLRSLRGWSMPVGVMDEVAFFRLEGQADAEVEVQASIRRGRSQRVRPRGQSSPLAWAPAARSVDRGHDMAQAFRRSPPRELSVIRAPALRPRARA